MRGDAMLDRSPSSLTTTDLASRLRDLTGDERRVQVDFLLHLDPFDQRRAYLEAGFGSLWAYLLGALHLREGAAARRIGAMRVLRRFPRLEAALRDGRLCLSTASKLAPILTEENVDEVVRRAAFKTTSEVDQLVAALHPRPAPAQGVRKLPQPQLNRTEHMSVASPAPHMAPTGTTPALAPAPPETGRVEAACSDTPAAPPHTPPEPHRVEVRPLDAALYSLRVTLDASTKADLDTLASLLSHTCGRDLAAVLREAIRCGLEKHGKRRGAVKPARPTRSAPQASSGSAVSTGRDIPRAVAREVWERDGDECTWIGTDGRRCSSRYQPEIDHIVPAALGGPSTVSNTRILCKAHNMLHAEQVYGPEHMARFLRSAQPQTGEATSAGGSGMDHP
jgi:5-methylcytosine-specific restriction endonuclease McrA